ncbi:zeta toxin family protein [Sediminibacterium sp.]|uniref:zeta toxin family protein n=1 Tax=Sediminibacterium sp. TaxID=1917865 RepID=UPI003F6978D4
MQRLKKLRIFCGPNGSGKSTLFDNVKGHFSEIPFINADEIERIITNQKWIDLSNYNLNLSAKDLSDFLKKSEAKSLIEKAKEEGHEIKIGLRENCIVVDSHNIHSYKAALIASFIRWAMYKNGNGFAFETVMSHKSKLKELTAAKKKGYKIYLYFVCIDNPDINIERVKDRVKKGGHNVNPDKLRARYYSTLENLYPAILLADRV